MIETDRLAIPAEHFDKALQRFNTWKPLVERNRTTYYDTDARDLWHSGYECRIRENDKGIKQTIKSRAGINTFSRTEIEAFLKFPKLDAEHLKAALPKPLAKSVGVESLDGVFKTEVTRRRVEWQSAESVIEAALDDGQIHHDGTSQSFREVEFELVSGSFRDLVAAVEAFIDAVPCTFQLPGKAERGYALAGIPAASFTRAVRPGIERDIKLPSAIRTVLGNALGHIMANQPGVLAGEAGAIHQMRVGLRRLRSAVASFGPVLDTTAAQASLAEVARLFKMLGVIRDDDVFLTTTLPTIPHHTFAPDQRAALIGAIEAHRASTHAEIRSHLDAPAFVRWTLDLQAWIDGADWMRSERPLDRLLQNRPVGDFAANRTRRLWKRLDRAGTKAMHGGTDDWHEVRKRLKKVRYSNEYLIDVGEHGTAHRKSMRRSIRKLQNALGRFNDIAMVPLTLDRIAPGGRPTRQTDLVNAAANRCIGWAAAVVEHRVDDLRNIWPSFAKETPR